MGVSGQRHATAALTPGKETRYPLYRRFGEPQGRSMWLRKISPSPRFDPRTDQPVASRYNCPLLLDYTIALYKCNTIFLIRKLYSRKGNFYSFTLKYLLYSRSQNTQICVATLQHSTVCVTIHLNNRVDCFLPQRKAAIQLHKVHMLFCLCERQ